MEQGLEKLTQEKIEALTLEVELLNGGDCVVAARTIFQKALPMAAREIVQAALFSTDEKVRFQASKYIVDKTMPREWDGQDGQPKSPLERLLGAIVKEHDEIVSNEAVDTYKEDLEFNAEEGVYEGAKNSASEVVE